MRQATTAEVRLDAMQQPGSPPRRGKTAALHTPCVEAAQLLIALIAQKGDPGLEAARNLASVGANAFAGLLTVE
jgi:hypothetical protein